MISNFIRGIVIGIAGIMPGLSGAVIAMIFGIYNDMICAVGNFFKDIKHNILFLLPILSGIAVGFVVFSNAQKMLLEKYPFYSIMAIIGLIIGTVPILLRDSHIEKFKLSYGITFAIALSVGIFMAFANDSKIDVQNRILELNFENILSLAVIGFIMAGSHIVPGISGTVILMSIGSYGIMLNTIANLKDLIFIDNYIQNLDKIIYNLTLIVPMGVGLLVGAIIFSKLMDYLIRYLYSHTYCAIIGFVIGSIPSIVPPMDLSSKTAVGILIILISAFVSYRISLIE